MPHDIPQSIVQPIVALLLLTLLVWAYMYYCRISYTVKNKINAQELSTPEKVHERLPGHINQSSNNFKNLCEAPVIFYTVCLLLMVLDKADPAFVAMAWVYVLSRVAHSVIHCFIANVLARFVAYLFSSVVLWVMVLKLAYVVF